MTREEFKKIPFHFASHLSLTDQYQTMYVDDSGRLAICEITERISEFETGKVHREYRIDNKWYDDKADFENALERIPAWTFRKKKGGE
jgi:hypothetical protein